jgi:ATP-binding protein involved in chromosome partitioning
MSISQEQISARLKELSVPGLPKNLVDLNMVKSINLFGNNIQIILSLRAPHSKNPEPIKKAIFESLNILDGVGKIEVQTESISNSQEKPKTEQEDPHKLLKGVKNILAIASGKGGVGKSTVTANLAMALALEGKSVGILDADIYGPSMNLMFNIQEAPLVNEDRSVYPVSVNGGILILSMAMFAESDKAVIWRGPMASQMIQNFISRCHWGNLDYLLIDMPPGTGDIHLTLTQNCPINGAIVVTTPQNVSVIDARKGLQMFETVKVPVLGVIENMSFFQTPDGEKHYILRSGGGARISNAVGVPFLGEIPMDPAVADGGDHGSPVTYTNPNHPISKKFNSLAIEIIQQLEEQIDFNTGMGTFDMTWDEIPLEDS